MIGGSSCRVMESAKSFTRRDGESDSCAASTSCATGSSCANWTEGNKTRDQSRRGQPSHHHKPFLFLGSNRRRGERPPVSWHMRPRAHPAWGRKLTTPRAVRAERSKGQPAMSRARRSFLLKILPNLSEPVQVQALPPRRWQDWSPKPKPKEPPEEGPPPSDIGTNHPNQRQGRVPTDDSRSSLPLGGL